MIVYHGTTVELEKPEIIRAALTEYVASREKKDTRKLFGQNGIENQYGRNCSLRTQGCNGEPVRHDQYGRIKNKNERNR